MKNKDKYYSVFKWLLIAIIIAASLLPITDASGVYTVQQYSKSGQSFIKIINKTNYNLYCVIEGYQYFIDFTLYANRSSRWYIEPIGEYIWECR